MGLVTQHNMAAAVALFVAFVVRLVFIAYGELQDRHMIVKYTDVDYNVFTDAASHVVAGNSPYLRPTYRYTPLVAWVLTPNVLLHPSFGKLVFAVSDILAGYLILLQLRRQGLGSTAALWASGSIWLFNPLIIAVSTRGNAESVVAVLVVATVYFVCSGRLTLAALVYGLAVHFKLYPVIYSLPLFLRVGPQIQKNVAPGSYSLRALRFLRFLFNPARLKFGVIALATFMSINSLMYYW